jgi:hypothetical protein
VTEQPNPKPTRRRILAGVAAGFTGSVASLSFVYQAMRTKPHLPQPPGETDLNLDPNPRLFSFVGGSAGAWRVTLIRPYIGETLPDVPRVDIVTGKSVPRPAAEGWTLRGVVSNERYATRSEKSLLVAKQEGWGRPAATHAALIPIRKTAAWWALTQDERRAIFEDKSRHVKTGMQYLPAVARRLHHCRDLETREPFDFITLFDFAERDAAAFEQLLGELRATEEWKYVDREVDIRMVRDGA